MYFGSSNTSDDAQQERHKAATDQGQGDGEQEEYHTAMPSVHEHGCPDEHEETAEDRQHSRKEEVGNHGHRWFARVPLLTRLAGRPNRVDQETAGDHTALARLEIAVLQPK